MNEEVHHTVVWGDTVTSIAAHYGLTWETLWNLPANKPLRDQRSNPNILQPGDTVVVPQRHLRLEDVATNERHRFVRKQTPSRYRVRLLKHGKARAGIRFECLVDGRKYSGKTDDAGTVSFSLPPTAKVGILILYENKKADRYELRFGHLDPISCIPGVQQRLSNLGFECRISGELDDQTSKAIRAFRIEHMGQGHDSACSDLDGPFKKKLGEIHGN